MSSILYALGLDNKSLLKDAEKSKSILRGISNSALEEGKKIDNTFRNIAGIAGGVFVFSQAENFVSKVARVRGEFQQLEVALTTMLGSKDKAEALMSKTVDFAAKTPFDLQGVANGTKQLLAYGSASETVTDELRMLGNIASGLSIPLNDMVYLYGTTRTQGRMYTQDLKQFMGRGIPIADELAKILGVQKDKIQELVSAGKVGFPEVEKALRNMTNEGGKFYNLMEEQSKTITGKMSNLGDAISQMFNDIGKSNEGIISDTLDSAGYLVENYEKVGEIIAELVAVYGTYKAALIAINVVRKFSAEMALQQALAETTLTTAQKIGAVATANLQRATKSLNLTMLANPYVLVAGAIAGLVYVTYKLATHLTEVEKAQKKVNEAFKESNVEISKEKQELDSLFIKLKDTKKGTEEYNKIKKQILQKYKPYIKGLGDEKHALDNQTEAYNYLNKAIQENIRLKFRNQTVDKFKEDYAKKDAEVRDKVYKFFEKNLKGKTKNGKSLISIAMHEAQDAINYANAKMVDKMTIFTDKNFKSFWGNGGVKAKNEFKKIVSELGDAWTNKAKAIHIADVKFGIKKPKKEDLNKEQEKEVKILRKKSDVLSEIRDKQNQINALRKKGNTVGFEGKDKDDLKQYQDDLKNLNKELELYTGKKSSSKSEKSTFDKLEFQKKQNRAIEDEKYESKIKQIKIDKEGYEQEIALMKAEHERKLVLIQRMEDDKLLELGKSADEAKKAGKSFDLSSQVEVWEQIFKKQRETENETYNHNETKVQQEHLKGLLEQYKTYEQQKEDVRKKYAKQREELQGQDYDKKKIDQAEAKELFEIEKKAGNIKSTIALVFSDLSGKTRAELDKIRQQAEKLYNFLSSGKWNTDLGTKLGIDKETFIKISADPKSLEALRKKIKELDVSSKSFADNLKTLFKKDVGVDEFSQSFSAVNSKIQAGIQGLNMFSDALQGISEISGNEMFGNIASGIKDITDLAGGVMQGAEAGKVFGPVGVAIGAGLGLVAGVISKIASAEKRHREALKKIQQSNIEQQRIYNQLLFEQKMLMKDAENIFGVDELAKAIGYTKAYEESFTKLQDKLKKKEGDFSIKIFGKEFKTGFKTFESTLDKIKIKTGHKKTGLFGWGRGKDIYSSITKEYDDLIDKEGKLNIKRAESILQTKEMREEDKKSLQEIINLYEQTEKANTELESYLKSTFGELGSGMMDSIVNSLKTGEDAFESFGKSAGNVMLKLGKQMIFSATLKPILDQMQKQIKETVKQGKGLDAQSVAKNVASVISNSMGEIKNGLEVGKLGLDAWNKEIKEKMNVDIFGKESEQQRQATQKGFASMTQDEGRALDGKLTLDLELSKQHLNVAKEISGSIKFIQEHSAQSLKHLAGIETNTATLHQVKKDIGGMKSTLNEIKDRGIKLKRNN